VTAERRPQDCCIVRRGYILRRLPLAAERRTEQ